MDCLGGNGVDSDDEKGHEVVDSDEEEVTLCEVAAAPVEAEDEATSGGSLARAGDAEPTAS